LLAADKEAALRRAADSGDADKFGAMWQRDTDKWARVVTFAAGKRQ